MPRDFLSILQTIAGVTENNIGNVVVFLKARLAEINIDINDVSDGELHDLASDQWEDMLKAGVLAWTEK